MLDGLKRLLFKPPQNRHQKQICDEHFVPAHGLDLEDYASHGDTVAVHHLIRYKWALAVIGELNGCKTLLDLGCGSGYGAFLIAKSFPNIEVKAVDYDPAAISSALKHYTLPNLSYAVAQASRWGGGEPF